MNFIYEFYNVKTKKIEYIHKMVSNFKNSHINIQSNNISNIITQINTIDGSILYVPNNIFNIYNPFNLNEVNIRTRIPNEFLKLPVYSGVELIHHNLNPIYLEHDNTVFKYVSWDGLKSRASKYEVSQLSMKYHN